MAIKIPFSGGFYEARSLIADAQKCTNLFPEKNPSDSEAPITLYPTPGLRLVNASAKATPFKGGIQGWRALYVAGGNAKLYGVCGQTVYYIPDNTFVPQALGAIESTGSVVSMTDNGTTLVMVDGTSKGYQITLATNSFSQISDPNFLGADRIDYVDTFFVSNVPGTREFQSSLSNSATWDPLFFASKVGGSDLLASIIVVHREIWLMGQTSSEVWYDVGGATFPFAILPGVFIQHGIEAFSSIATYDLMTFWLDSNPAGHAMVMMGRQYQAVRISTHAIEHEIASYTRVTDAIGLIYQQEGHTFYVLQFPAANRTWAYDLATGLWHQRAWYNPATQAQELWRPSAMAAVRELVVAGDWENSNLYLVDLDVYTDFDGPIVRERSYPHLIKEGGRVHYAQFSADIQAGALDPEGPSPPTWMSLRWSDNRGASYGNRVRQSFGQGGQFLVQPKWSRLGMARDRVFELSWSVPAKTALQGAFIDIVPLGS